MPGEIGVSTLACRIAKCSVCNGGISALRRNDPTSCQEDIVEIVAMGRPSSVQPGSKTAKVKLLRSDLSRFQPRHSDRVLPRQTPQHRHNHFGLVVPFPTSQLRENGYLTCFRKFSQDLRGAHSSWALRLAMTLTTESQAGPTRVPRRLSV